MKKANTIRLIFLLALILSFDIFACRPPRVKSYVKEVDDYVFVMIINWRVCNYIKTEKDMSYTEYQVYDSKSRKEKWEFTNELSRIYSDAICLETGNQVRRGKIIDSSDDLYPDGNTKKLIQFKIKKWNPIVFKTENGSSYSQPGLYKNNGDKIPLWTIDGADWESRRFDIFVSKNGRHLVRLNHTSFDEGAAISFYDNGALIKEYMVSELIRDTPNIQKDMDYCFGGEWAGKALKADDNRIVVDTRNQESYVFDLKTGEIIEKKFNPVLAIKATLTLMDNTKVDLHRFRACDGFATVQLLQGNADEVYGVFGYTKKSLSHDKESMSISIVPFSSINNVSKNGDGNNPVLWRIELKNADVLDNVAIEGTTNYCGKTESGKKVNIHPDQIKSIVIY